MSDLSLLLTLYDDVIGWFDVAGLDLAETCSSISVLNSTNTTLPHYSSGFNGTHRRIYSNIWKDAVCSISQNRSLYKEVIYLSKVSGAVYKDI